MRGFASLGVCSLLLTSTWGAWGAEVAAAPAPAPVASGRRVPLVGERIDYGLDVNVEGGIGSVIERGGVAAFGRLRAGLLVEIEPRNPQLSPLLVSLGGFYEASSISAATLGVQAEMVHVTSGFWLQAAPALDVLAIEPAFMIGAGWSIFGAELQRRVWLDGRAPGDGAAVTTVFAKIRLPVTLLWRALRR